jgi:hypothetical protein
MVDNLIRKQWKGESNCKLCLSEESVDHLIFLCPLATFIWSVIKEGLKWKHTPKSVKEFNDNYHLERGNKNNGVLFFLFGVVHWTLWLNRNDWVFRNRLLPSPNAILYNTN